MMVMGEGGTRWNIKFDTLFWREEVVLSGREVEH